MKPLTATSEEIDRRVLLAERDAARKDRILRDLRDELAEAERKLVLVELEAAEYLRQIGRLEDRLDQLFNSASWRWSAPVRRVIAFVARLKVSLGGTPPAALPGPAPVAAQAAKPTPLSLRERAILHRLQRRG